MIGALLLAAYLIGAVPTSYLIGRMARGIDLREHGSGNLGATNAFRVLGWRLALPVLLIDVFKGWFPAFVFPRLDGAGWEWALAYGAAAILGHVFSVYVNFKGGKGVATGAGVFLALAPFMPKPRLVGIFGRNLLDDAGQVAGYDALMEYRDHKPFECVGEARESRAAMAALAARPEWREDAVVARFRQVVLPQLDQDELAIAPLLVPDPEHGIPDAVWSRLHAYFAA